MHAEERGFTTGKEPNLFKYFMGHKISTVFLNPGKKQSNAGEIFVASPDEYKESLAGKLFIIIEIESRKSKALKVVNFLVNNLNYNYYQSDKILLREKMDSITVEHIFETALTNVNKDLVDFLNREKIKISPYSINVTAGVLHKGVIYFSSVGKNRNLLLYPVAAKNEEKKYYISDIGDSQKQKTQTTNLFKLFSDVISGPLPEDGYYLLTNEALKEYLSDKQITEVVTKLPPASAATHIENILTQLNINALFLGIVIKNTAGVRDKVEKDEKEEASDQIFDLNHTRKRTEDILMPAGVFSFKKLSGLLKTGYSRLSKLTKIKKEKPVLSYKDKKGEDIANTKEEAVNETKKQQKIQLKEKLFFEKKSSSFSFAKAGNAIKTTLLSMLSVLLYILKFFSSTDNIKKLLKKSKNIPSYLSGKLGSIPRGFISLPKKSKLILFVSIILILGFGLSTRFYINQNEHKENLAAITDTISQIETKQNKIEANLLYDNKKDAKKLILENTALLNKLKKNINILDEEKKNKYYELSDKQEKQKQEIMHAIKLEEDLKLIKNLNDTDSQSSPKNFTLLDNFLYLTDSANKTVYKINIDNNDLTTFSNENLSGLSSATVYEEKIYYLSGENLISLNTENEEVDQNGIKTVENSVLKDIDVFADRLYTLDTGNNQIYKYNELNNLNNAQKWLNENADLQNATDLEIDGNIFTLHKNGVINKYYKGSRENFEPEKPFPEIKNATKMQITEEMNKGKIYILEPEQKRLLVFSKTDGKFIKQYNSDKFSDLKDFYVDEETDTIYFLDSNSLYRASIEG